MADKERKPKKRQLRKVQTVRERAEKAGAPKNPRRLKQAGTTVIKPLRAAKRVGRKEYYLPIPDNKVGRFINKRRRVIPSYFGGAWQELRQVKWPGGKETAKLTFAVFMFAIFMATIVTVADFGLDKIFKNVFLK